MKLIKTTLYSGFISFVRIISGFISVKIVASIIGPSGIAAVGAFSNFLSIILTFSNGAINSGIIKYTAEYADDEKKQKLLFSTATRITLICSLICGIIIIILSSYISQLLFGSDGYYDVIICLGLSLFFYSLNSVLVSILNGLGKIGRYTIVNTVGAVFGLILTLILVHYWGVKGALYALILSQTLVFFTSILLLLKEYWLNKDYLFSTVDKEISKSLFKYSSMAIVTALTVPVSQILVRNYIIKEFGISDAGIWQGMTRLSDAYLTFVNMALVTYYLPKLSSISDTSLLRKEIFRGYKLLVPVTVVLCLSVFLMRTYIIEILFTKDFLPMEHLFKWQILGDFFKICSYVLAFLMVAQAKTKFYIITEILFSGSYILLSIFFTRLMGLEGSSLAFCINYFGYLCLMIIYFRKLVFQGKENKK
ncbi:O-antigen translocase [Sphingobacterium sp. JUb56]|uniref:O-antigen translocase n=1 Tax=Sphingobacterium sp. JUb56 TaxID=2587145 RepID=UPI0016080D9A|nr:O-antigen translocase [Sphingobacterium sp. JUb56]MBB2954346.1 PST family polysaccharide transporter [Sphingobacterium sp. JUb56]